MGDMQIQAVRRDALAPLSADEVSGQVRLIQEVMRGVMRDGEHYGTVPGCGEKKVLLKSGAEKLALTFRLRPEYDTHIIDLPGNHREVRVVCTIRLGDGSVLGQGVGSCSTMESKYRYRSEATGRTVPKQYWETRDPALLGGDQFQAKKSGGAWLVVHRVEVKDVADAYNTVLKMAAKRALVHAVITATAAGDIFAQDLEEEHLARGEDGEEHVAEPKAPVARPRARSDAGAKEKTGIVRAGAREGKTKDGKPWKLWTVECEDVTASTFDSKLGELAEFLDGGKARIAYRPGRKEGTLELTAIEAAEDGGGE